MNKKKSSGRTWRRCPLLPLPLLTIAALSIVAAAVVVGWYHIRRGSFPGSGRGGGVVRGGSGGSGGGGGGFQILTGSQRTLNRHMIKSRDFQQRVVCIHASGWCMI
jgi:hypothetical protein